MPDNFHRFCLKNFPGISLLGIISLGMVLNISPFVVAHEGCILVIRVTTEGASSSVSIQKSHPILIFLLSNVIITFSLPLFYELWE